MRDGITLACTECKRRNYRTNKNKKNNAERNDEVLQMVQEAHPAQGNQVIYLFSELGCKHGETSSIICRRKK